MLHPQSTIGVNQGQTTLLAGRRSVFLVTFFLTLVLFLFLRIQEFGLLQRQGAAGCRNCHQHSGHQSGTISLELQTNAVTTVEQICLLAKNPKEHVSSSKCSRSCSLTSRTSGITTLPNCSCNSLWRIPLLVLLPTSCHLGTAL